MSSAPRIRSRGSEPPSSRASPSALTLPMMIWVTLLARAQASTSSAIRSPGQDQGLAAQPLGQPQRVGDPVVRGLAGAAVAGGLDMDRGPGRLQPVGQPLGVADQLGRTLAAMHADQQPLAGGPGAGEPVRAHVLDHLVVDALGRAAQRQLAQRGQVAGLK